MTKETGDLVTISVRLPKGLLQFVKDLHEIGGDIDTDPKRYCEQAIISDARSIVDGLPGMFFDRDYIYEKYGIGKVKGSGDTDP